MVIKGEMREVVWLSVFKDLKAKATDGRTEGCSDTEREKGEWVCGR